MVGGGQKLLLGIGIVLLMSAMAYAQDGESLDGQAAFPGLNLSPQTPIYAAGGVEGSKLDWQIDDSGYNVGLIKVAVNSPDEPVVLMLSAYKPIIWHIGWTEGTRVAAVLVSGYYSQRIVGLPQDVPVVNSSNKEGGAYGYFSASRSDSYQVDSISKRLFGRKPDKVFEVADGQVVVGEPLPADVRLVTHAALRKEDFYDPYRPLAGQAGLDEAVRAGLIREATEDDLREYLAVRARGAGLPEHMIAEGFVPEDSRPVLRHPYVVISPDFIIPDGLFGADAATFILPEGVTRSEDALRRERERRPQGMRTHSSFISLDELKSPSKPAKRISGDCGFPGLELPPGLKVYAVGSYAGSRLKMQIDDGGSFSEGTLMRITVNSPDEPVALLLGNYESTIWQLSITEGTKISAVVVSGYHEQHIAGLPEGVPVLNNYYQYNPSLCPWFYVSRSFENALTLNSLSNHLFKKDINEVYYVADGQALVGRPLSAGVELAAPELNIEDFSVKNRTRAVLASLDEAVLRGLIKKATLEDVHDCLAAVARGAGLPDHLIAEAYIEGDGSGDLVYRVFSPDAYRSSRFNLKDAYVVLSPDFVIPGGLIKQRAVFFILPEGLPSPRGPIGDCGLYSVDEARSKIKPARRITTPCTISGYQAPPDLKVYAVGAQAESTLDFPIDVGYDKTTLMRLTVNSPQEPAALLLESEVPTIWHFTWTEGTKISAVVVSGRHEQHIAGLPEDVPILYNHDGHAVKCPEFHISSSLSDLLALNGLSNHLFKKDIDRVYYPKDGTPLIGQPMLGDEKLATAAEFKAEKYNDPEGGKEILRRAEIKGQIRKADENDRRQWYARYFKRMELPFSDKKIEEINQKGPGYFRDPQSSRVYVILLPDFVAPEGLYGENTVNYIVPGDLPVPYWLRTYKRTLPTFFFLKDGTCAGPKPGCLSFADIGHR